MADGKIIGVYAIINIIDGKRYIGQSIDVYNRWWENNHPNRYLQRAYNKHGCENFCYCILKECSEEELTKIEDYYIKLYANNYNLREAGPRGHHSEESKQKNRIAHLGKKASEETKKKMSLSQRGRKGSMKGKHHSEETKRKMRESHKHFTPVKYEDTFSKISVSVKNLWKDDSYRKNMSAKHSKGKVLCVETNRVFDSASEIERDLHIYNIRGVIDIENRTAGGYHWRSYNGR